jgi:hypothetical protein
MGTIAVADFRYGIDRRRPRVAGAAGTMWDCQNAHLTRGGDVESPRAMVPQYVLPAGLTFGLAQAAGQLYTFGSGATPTMPPGIGYQRLSAETGANMIRVLDAKAFQGAVYAIAEFDDGIIRHFYNGNRVTDWNNNADSTATFQSLVSYLARKVSADSTVTVQTSPTSLIITANTPGTPFALSATAVDGGSATDATISLSNFVAPAVGVAQSNLGTLTGTYQPRDTYTLYVNGTPYNVTGQTSQTTTAAAMAAAMAADPSVTAVASFNTILITAKVVNTAYTLTSNVANGGSVNDQTATVATPQPNVTAIVEDPAEATVSIIGGNSNPGVYQVQQITLGAVSLMGYAVDWALSNEATAAAVAQAIDDNAAANGGYTASEASGVITITAPPGLGATPNGTALSVTAVGVPTSTTPMAGGITAVSAVAQVSTVTLGGTLEWRDLYTITLNGVPYIGTPRASGMGTIIFVNKQRVYSPAGSFLWYSKLNDATNFNDNVDPASGSGFIDVSVLTDGSDPITGLAVYAGYTAIFTTKTVLLYFLDPDATAVSLFQQLPNTGTFAGLSALAYGLDTFYLDVSGVRSLRARDASDTAILNDIGTPLDTFLQEWVQSVGNGVTGAALALIEPFDNRYWLVIGSRIFVLSLFQTAGISAWSYYDFGLTLTAFARIYNRLYARAGDTVYLYGGPGGTTYPAAGSLDQSIALPFMSAQSPTLFKEWVSFDTANFGAWTLTFLVDPDDETLEVLGGTVVDSTYSGAMNALVGRTPLFAIRFDCSSGGKTTLSNFSAHYDEEDEK